MANTGDYVLDESVLDRLWPWQALTLKEWEAIPDYELHKLECVEGVVTVQPKRSFAHQSAITGLAVGLHEQAPADLAVLPSTYVIIEQDPLTVRRPDLVLLDRDVLHRGDDYWPTADDAQLIIEVIGEGTRRIDRVLKLSEYADAGVPEYWILDLDGPPTLSVHRLAERGHYDHVGDLTGHVSVPLASSTVDVDLTDLG